MALDPLDTATRSDVVTKRLQHAIALGLLRDGAPLPSEADLAAQLQVSNVTVRASLAELRRQGLIETRRGRGGGSFIKAGTGQDRSILERQLLALNIDEIRDTRDLHVAVSGRAAYLAAIRARGYELSKLTSLAESLGQANTPSERVRADFRFHAELAAATRSAELTRVEVGIMTTLAPLLWIADMEAKEIKNACAQHQAIVAAVIRQDSETARSLAENHIQETLDGLIELRMQLGRIEGDRP
ncbi:FadR/GntR family transcriptional regulator [Gordonia mangrovi]|uniref:FadR/GntR family transcriptional regulator n=1 Tax=Gordonia mangrovi TaxID=2665643 RepID=UPI0013687EAE|nr:FCD domain-containing protein [Gordonia mangrovi]UVF76656.1 FCD domain-containing protein [Gordonia mangrovi]